MAKYISILELILIIGGAVANGCGGNANGVKMVASISRA
jgi:hypothetical protein